MGSSCRAVFWLSVVMVSILSRGSLAMTASASDAAEVLASRFETVFYTRSGLLLDSAPSTAPSTPIRKSLRAPFAYSLDDFNLGSHTTTEMLSNATAVLVGARDFRAPNGPGAVQSQSCYIIILNDKSGFNLSKNLPTSTSALRHEASVVWTWSTKVPDGQNNGTFNKLYAVQMNTSYVVLCKNLTELEVVADKLSNKDPQKRVLSDPALQSLIQFSYWGYRRYRQNTDSKDRVAAGLSLGPESEITPGAQELTFWVTSDGTSSRLRLLAKDKDTAQNINSLLQTNRVSFLLTATRAGVWEANIDVRDEKRGVLALFHVMTLFGFGVYV